MRSSIPQLETKQSQFAPKYLRKVLEDLCDETRKSP